LGVSISLMDFLADGLHVKKTPLGRLGLSLLTFAPPLYFAISYPRIFFIALGYAGGFGVAILLGLLPALMVWSGRYRLGLSGAYQAPGGKAALLAAMVVSAIVVANELYLKVFN
jgi:tyrosine-specific transport protein